MKQLLVQLPRQPLGSLVSQGCWESILELASFLPPLSGGMFEVHLNCGEPRTDFLIRADISNGGRQALAGENAEWDIPLDCLQRKIWQKIRTFAQRWANPQHPLYETIENAWLEFDLPPHSSAVADPSLFIDLDRHQRFSNRQRTTSLRHTFTALDHDTRDDFFPSLQAILEQGSSNSFLRHVGFMFPRPDSTLRICIAELKATEISTYLQRLDCAGHAQIFQSVLADYGSLANKLMLDLDITPAIGSKVGLEILPARRNWPEFFDKMKLKDYCTKEQSEAILNWSGEQPLADDLFRQSVSKVLGYKVSQLIRRISHVKFVASATGQLESKVYLYFGYS